MVAKKPGELALAAFFVFLGITLFISSLSFPERAQTSTAVYVRFVGAGMAVLAALDFFLTLRKEGGTVELFTSKVYFFGLVGLMVVYLILLMLDLGFMISTIPFLAAASLLLGYRNWKVMGVSFVTILVLTYLIFFRLLQVPMP
jgi:Tripartite tricarboxylate transporter TctB family